MINYNEEKTIAAISTAYGEGGIGIVRMSGNEAHSILNRIFRSNVNEISELKNRYLHYGNIVDPVSEKVIDEVLVTLMKAPSTYTKEDVCEIYCHGSIVSLRKILELVLSLGAAPAEAGEFTKKAFLNGRIDLSQAEAVIDVIKAKSDVGFELAVDQMEGSVSRKINELRENILNIIAGIVVEIDYPDEDRDAVGDMKLKERLTATKEEIDELINTANTGKMIREGINTVIVGKPNVGKSSLMNELLKESRAIVTEVPGTTRDTIEEVVNISGISVKLTDTAGIRETSDKIEKIGIEKTKEAFNKADLVIFMMDGQSGIDESDMEIAENIGDRKCFVVINKIDLGRNISGEQVNDLVRSSKVIEMSLTKNTGLDELESSIAAMVFSGNLKQADSLMITNVRHRDLLIKASAEIDEAIQTAEAGEALDFVHVNINQAFEYLGEITGQTVTDDIMEKVFGEFCVGK